MRKRRVAIWLFWVLLPLVLFPAVFLPVRATDSGSRTLPAEPDAKPRLSAYEVKVDAALQTAVTNAEPGELIRFIIHLQETAKLAAVPAFTKESRGAAVVAQLRQTAASSQKALLNQLETLQKDGHISRYRPFWIINGVGATGTAEAIRQIASQPEVKEIRLDIPRRYFDPPAESINLEAASEVTTALSTGLPWGIERVGADKVWDGLGIDGTGVTVAIMDTGVDWRHPALIDNYRGNLGNGIVNHSGNWYSTVTPTVTEPLDLFGHGTHVAGTAVGKNGIGIAPGAQWIAVGIADEYGLIYESDVHEGFQWIMAPDGNPALAPDIVNNSWGGSPLVTVFYEDVKALQAAGIITVFAAGNDGPFAGSINSPASYTDTLAVGASDDLDEVAWFSARGPSLLTTDLKPWLVAPGTRVLSSLPEGEYGYFNGTSMATPHVAGTIALLKSANPSLTRPAILQILADTAKPVNNGQPNNNSGWGRLDAYAAVASQVQTGLLHGQVVGDGTPLANVTVIVTTTSGAALSFVTDAAGRYQAALRPGLYSALSAAYGFVADNASGLLVIANQATSADFDLERLPGGVIQGTVYQAGGSPLTGSVIVLDTPVAVNTDNDGRFAIELPQGRYQLRVSATGHRLSWASLQVTAGQTIEREFPLEPAPAILLIDTGQWYYQSYASLYQSSLDDLGYAYDLRTIRNPVEHELTAADLQPYDFVIWSAPRDSPGTIGANDVITDYLGAGGNLLISGQNVGNYDGYGFDTQMWWHRDLKGRFLGKTFVTQTLTGSLGSIFDGLSLTLNGGDSADNHTAVDRSRPQPGSLTRQAVDYPDGTAAGLLAGHCDPFRIVYLGFGLEGVSERANRGELLERSFDYFQSPRLAAGTQWEPGQVDDFAVAGSHLVYTLTVRNLSEITTDTFQLNVTSSLWPSSLTTRTMTLGSCQSGQTVLSIDVPEDLPRDSVHSMQLRAVSTNDQRVTADIVLNHKVPGYMLLVDDDRWYNQEAEFRAALDANGFSYDVWENGWDDQIRGSPPLELLNAYDLIIWYTAYDWFAPITHAENSNLTNYLAQGGRLFLTSQDFMYYHQNTALARNYLGVVAYQESITPTRVFGGDNPLLPVNMAGPLVLDYGPYQNFSDGLIPGSDSQSFIWHDQGMPAGVASRGPDWRTIFWSFPFETLPLKNQAQAMNSIVGWLSDLGDSSFEVDRRTSAAGAPLTYTIALRNLAHGPASQVWLTNTLPSGLLILPDTITGGANYDPARGRILWQGVLDSGATHQIRYQAIPDPGLTAGTRLDNTITLHYARHDLSFDRSAPVWIAAPDLSGSTFAAEVTSPAPTQIATYTLHLANRGQQIARPAIAEIHMPDQLRLVTDTLRASGGSARLQDGRIFWQGAILPGDQITVSFAMTREMSISPLWLPATAMINDGVTNILVRDIHPYLRPYQAYLTWIARN